MSRNIKPRKSVTTMWTDPHTLVTYTIQARAALNAAEMREISRWTAQLQFDLRTGAKPLVTTMHSDAPSALQATVVTAKRQMQQPVQMQQSRASVDYDWHAQNVQRIGVQKRREVASERIVTAVRIPMIGQTFIVSGANGMLREWQITGTFSAWGEMRFTARATDSWGPRSETQTFERIAQHVNQWRAFQQPDACVFSL